MLVRVKLHASKFETFICNVPKKVISVSMQHLNLLLKSMMAECSQMRLLLEDMARGTFAGVVSVVAGFPLE
jgi:hypothetical protein